MEIPPTLMRTFNHMDCGIYAEVIGAGDIAVGDAVRD
jgi:MOSC domain-containing protein YiiM